MNEIDDILVTEKVGALFEEHGVGLAPSDYWLAHESGYAISVDASVREQLESRLAVQLDIDVSLPDGRLITESFIGLGNDADEAVDDAIENFRENSLFVFLTAFFKAPPKGRVIVESWKIDGAPWRIVAGNFGCCQSKKNLVKSLPDQLFSEMENAIKGSRLHNNSHWFRLFFSQQDGTRHPLELLMDNEPWHAAKEPLSRVPWQKTEGYYSVRGFVIATRETPVEVSIVKADKAIKSGMEMVLNAWEQDGASEADVYRRLTNAHIDPDVAERLLAFTPLGFSSVFLKGADLPDTYNLMVQGEAGPDRLLEEEPVFVEARKRALKTPKALLRRYASRCSMVDAVSQAVDDMDDLTEERLKDFEFVAPSIFIPRFRPEEPRRVSWWKKVVDRVSRHSIG